MWQKNQTIHVLGRHYRELHGVEAVLPLDMRVLLLRLALKEVERLHYGVSERKSQASVA